MAQHQKAQAVFDVNIRQANPTDIYALADVMFDAVRNGPSDYTASQRRAWMPALPDEEHWADRLRSQWVTLAEQAPVDDAKSIVGFMTLTIEGYIDLAFIRPQAQGRGVFRAIYEYLESFAISQAIHRLTVHASLMARGPFEAMGFTIDQNETVIVNQEPLERFEMSKSLAAKSHSR